MTSVPTLRDGTTGTAPHGGRKILVVAETAACFGAAIARDFARRGYDVVVGSAIDGASARQVRADVEASGVRASAHTWSFDDPDSIDALAESARHVFGGVDLLISNLTATAPQRPMLDTPAAEWAGWVDRVVWSSLLLARAVVPAMTSRGGGRITYVTDTSGARGRDATASAIQQGIVGLVRGVAREQGENGIVANAVCVDGIGDGDTDLAAPENGLRRTGTTDELLAAVRAMSDDANGYVSGQCLYVNGGTWFL